MSYVNTPKIKDIVKRALAEDIGKGDITVKLLFPKGGKVQAVISADDTGVICGVDIACLVFKLLDNNIRFIPRVKDGARVSKGQIVAKIYGRASSILTGERVALNFLGLLSAIATRTNKFVSKIKGYKVKVMDTRKTIPGLRELEKYAVRVGGGYNHRFGLDEMVLIKENHLMAFSPGCSVWSIKKVIKTVKENKKRNLKLEIEVKNLRELKQALKANPGIVMLDNMSVKQVKKAVAARDKLNPKLKIEVSGNIDLRNICTYARTGVDFISSGILTKDVHYLDLSLEVK